MAEMSQCAAAAAVQSQTGNDQAGPPPARGARGRAAIPRAERQAILLRTVKLDVIPQLVSLVRGSEAAVAPPAITEVDVATLANLAVHGRDVAAGLYVARLREQGVQAEALFLDLLTPVARLLGEWWEQDICGFAEVTTGLWRLQDAMHVLRPAFLSAAPLPSGPRILLAPMCGEQHSFGLSMVHEFFRRAGWNVWSGPVDDPAELERAVADQWVDAIGFSGGSDERLDAAREVIRAVRGASRNPGLVVLVGGPMFVASPGLAADLGADGTASDGAQAVALATRLVSRHAGEGRQRG